LIRILKKLSPGQAKLIKTILNYLNKKQMWFLHFYKIFGLGDKNLWYLVTYWISRKKQIYAFFS